MSIEHKITEYQRKLYDELPSYAFAYEDCDKYVRTEYMQKIEKQVSDKRNEYLSESKNKEHVQNCRAKSYTYQKELIDALPSYAFAYEDGDKYVRREYMIQIEKQVADKYAYLLDQGSS